MELDDFRARMIKAVHENSIGKVYPGTRRYIKIYEEDFDALLDLVAKPVTVAVCGPSKTCDHKWDGPERVFDDGRGSEATCSKCGIGAMEFDLWTAP